MAFSSTSESVLNFRKLRHDFSTSHLKEGKNLFEKKAVQKASLTCWTESTITVVAKVKGQFNETHTCQLEVMRLESDIAYSSCDCTQSIDCQHIACLLFYLEHHFPELLVQFLQKDDDERTNKLTTKEKVGKAAASFKASYSDANKQSNNSLSSSLHGLPSNISVVSANSKKSHYEKNEKDDFLSQLPTADIAMKEAERKSREKVRERQEKHLLEEYSKAGVWLCRSSLASLTHCELKPVENAELYIAIGSAATLQPKQQVEIHLAVKIPGKLKPILIQQPKLFLQALYLEEPMVLGTTKTLLNESSFGKDIAPLIAMLRERSEVVEKQDKDGKFFKVFYLPSDGFIHLISTLFVLKEKSENHARSVSLIEDSFDSCYELFTKERIKPKFSIKLLKNPHNTLHIEVFLPLPQGEKKLRDVKLFHAKTPFIQYNGKFFLLDQEFNVRHALDLESLEDITIPESLFTTFVAYSLPSLSTFGTIAMTQDVASVLQEYSNTITENPISKVCVGLNNDEDLSIEILFQYANGIVVPEIQRIHTFDQIQAFTLEGAQANTKGSCFARNFIYEKTISQEIAWGMLYDEKKGTYTTKAERKAQEFFAEVVAPRLSSIQWNFDDRVQELYNVDEPTISIHMGIRKHDGQENTYQSPFECTASITVSSSLEAVLPDRVMDAVKNKKLAVDTGRSVTQSEATFGLKTKQLLLDEKVLLDLAELIYDISIPSFVSNTQWHIPLWVVFGLESASYPNLRLEITKEAQLLSLVDSMAQFQEHRHEKENKVVSCHLEEIQNCKESKKKKVNNVQAARYNLRSYQQDGVAWINRLRDYGLCGILADDMGLGKTLQTIASLSQLYLFQKSKKENEVSVDNISHLPTLIVCPTSLVDNWKEEIEKFEPQLGAIVYSGSPQERKKIAQSLTKSHIIITSYGILQKDIEYLEQLSFAYVILDEAQTIKNRETRNARSVKRLKCYHRLVLTGTPVENSLEDMWSLFDFLMPGFLGNYERFSSTYIKMLSKEPGHVVNKLKRRIQPFVLRRMKQDVLDDLPPISHHIYYSSLKGGERALYEEYAKRAKAELQKMVEEEGFDKVRLHVLATISKLKQICCHPKLVTDIASKAVATTDAATSVATLSPDEITPASKYELLMEILNNLIASGRKTVIFSQYTKMLSIIRQELEEREVKYLYLDGSTKNRLQLVKQFNDDPLMHVFLISLKAGGTGLNLVGADTVIHYDLWWNPAVENQATDRVWRMGQKTKVSSYKLVAKGTIEEKIAELQEKKKDLIGDIVQSDEDALSLLNYDDVMTLLQDV